MYPTNVDHQQNIFKIGNPSGEPVLVLQKKKKCLSFFQCLHPREAFALSTFKFFLDHQIRKKEVKLLFFFVQRGFFSPPIFSVLAVPPMNGEAFALSTFFPPSPPFFQNDSARDTAFHLTNLTPLLLTTKLAFRVNTASISNITKKKEKKMHNKANKPIPTNIFPPPPF